MKNKQNALATMKYTLNKKKHSGIKEVLWSLTPAQIDYIERLGYSVTPGLYEIRTKRLDNVKYVKSQILKEVNASARKGMKVLYRSLGPNQIQILKENHISYKIIKHKIVL